MNCFALSRIFYIAAVLPITKTAVKNINNIVGDFVWRRSGKVLRIAYSEIVNSELRGGMGLLDTEAMSNSLIVSQLFRLMKSGDIKSQNHLYFWMADYFEGIWDGRSGYVTVGNGDNQHFNALADCLTKSQLQEDFDIAVWKNINNKMIYNSYAKSFVKTKVEREASYDMKLVWRRLTLLNYAREVQEVTFLMLHNKLPVQERLYRVHLSKDPYCLLCPNAEFQDICHFFTGCEGIIPYWRWTRELCYSLLGNRNIEEESLLKFQWPVSSKDRDICWLITHYNFIIWDILYNRKQSVVREKEFFGYMRFKYKEALIKNKVSGITGLL